MATVKLSKGIRDYIKSLEMPAFHRLKFTSDLKREIAEDEREDVNLSYVRNFQKRWQARRRQRPRNT